DISIRLYDRASGLVRWAYAYEHGLRLNLPDGSLAEMPGTRYVIENQKPILGDQAAWDSLVGVAPTPPPGTDLPVSVAYVPILSRGEAIGAIALDNYERADAFGPADLRLLETLAASLGVALENARLFNETKRLLDETRQRNAELAVIN